MQDELSARCSLPLARRLEATHSGFLPPCRLRAKRYRSRTNPMRHRCGVPGTCCRAGLWASARVPTLHVLCLEHAPRMAQHTSLGMFCVTCGTPPRTRLVPDQPALTRAHPAAYLPQMAGCGCWRAVSRCHR